jgi:hypothetical protein
LLNKLGEKMTLIDYKMRINLESLTDDFDKQLEGKKDLQIAIFVNGDVMYKTISKIKKIEGDFPTVSIRKISQGKHLIVDGFIQKIED